MRLVVPASWNVNDKTKSYEPYIFLVSNICLYRSVDVIQSIKESI